MSSFVTRCRFFAVCAAVLCLVGCESAPKVRSDFDRTVNFAALRTFGFPAQTGTDRGGYSTLITSHFKEAIKREMSALGYTYAETNPDMTINFYSEARDKTRVYPSFYPYGYGYPYWGGGLYYGYPRYYGWYSAWPFYYNGVDVVQYTSGLFKIDAVDPTRQQTIWEASVEEPLSDKEQDNPQPNIARLVTEMFKKFPRAISSAQ